MKMYVEYSPAQTVYIMGYMKFIPPYFRFNGNELEIQCIEEELECECYAYNVCYQGVNSFICVENDFEYIAALAMDYGYKENKS